MFVVWKDFLGWNLGYLSSECTAGRLIWSPHWQLHSNLRRSWMWLCGHGLPLCVRMWQCSESIARAHAGVLQAQGTPPTSLCSHLCSRLQSCSWWPTLLIWKPSSPMISGAVMARFSLGWCSSPKFLSVQLEPQSQRHYTLGSLTSVTDTWRAQESFCRKRKAGGVTEQAVWKKLFASYPEAAGDVIATLQSSPKGFIFQNTILLSAIFPEY